MTGRVLCGDECRSVVHVSLVCPAYKDSRGKFVINLRAILGVASKDLEALDNIEKTIFVLGCELWTKNFEFDCLNEGVHNQFERG